jgi:hypothetical protein
MALLQGRPILVDKGGTGKPAPSAHWRPRARALPESGEAGRVHEKTLAQIPQLGVLIPIHCGEVPRHGLGRPGAAQSDK